MTTIAYVRFGRDDLEQRQAQADLSVRDIDMCFEDRGNARSGIRAMMRSVRMGDTIVTTKLSQLGLGVGQLVRLMVELRERGVHFATLSPSEMIDTRSAAGWSWFSHMLSLAAMEREVSRSRVADAEIVSIGPSRGRKGGRPRKLSPEKVEEIRQECWRRTNHVRLKDIAKQFGISKQTLYTRVLHTPDPGLNYNL